MVKVRLEAIVGQVTAHLLLLEDGEGLDLEFFQILFYQLSSLFALNIPLS